MDGYGISHVLLPDEAIDALVVPHSEADCDLLSSLLFHDCSVHLLNDNQTQESSTPHVAGGCRSRLDSINRVQIGVIRSAIHPALRETDTLFAPYSKSHSLQIATQYYRRHGRLTAKIGPERSSVVRHRK